MSVVSTLRFLVLASLTLVAACSKELNPCDDKLVVLEGDGVIQVVSQWDACVARNALKIANNRVTDSRLAEIAIELCNADADRYAEAVRRQTPKLSQDQVDRLVGAYQSNLPNIAISELRRTRKLGCEVK